MNKLLSGYLQLFSVLLFSVALIGFAGCKKENATTIPDYRLITSTIPVSNARIVNLWIYSQVNANGTQLTDSSYVSTSYKYVGNKYFPAVFTVDNTWPIPKELFKTDGSIDLKFGLSKDMNLIGLGITTLPEISFTLDATKPMDYYILPEGTHNFKTQLPNYTAVPRSDAPPSNPQNFKIRIINLCETIVPELSASLKAGGAQEDLTGPVTLAYADGTPVSATTSNISASQTASDYIELPYGTYQFRVLTANGRQIPGAGTKLELHPPTSNIDIAKVPASETTRLTYAQMKTYEPGGVYTIVITPYNFNYFSNSTTSSPGAYQNAYHVITDVSPAANINYFRLQGVNALPVGGTVGFRINGKDPSIQLALGNASPYGVYGIGDTKIDAVDATGKVLASVTQTLRAAQNYTAWLYPDATGTAQILLTLNDLSSDYIFAKRFLNLSQDEPYVTFTIDNGQLYGIPADNLALGVPYTTNPYITGVLTPDYQPYQILAYRSTPSVIPGTWAQDIPVLKSVSFVANTALYTTPGRIIPTDEPGVYTVALIGRSGNADPSIKQRIIIVKHNQ